MGVPNVPQEVSSLHAGEQSQSPLAPWRILYDEDGNHDEVVSAIQTVTRQSVYGPAIFRRLFTLDRSRHALVVLHRISGACEIEMLVGSHRMIWTPGIIRALARWVFIHLEQRRLIFRCPSHDRRSQDFARRLGFRFEGRAERYFADDVSASIWAMTAANCPWLPLGNVAFVLGARDLASLTAVEGSH